MARLTRCHRAGVVLLAGLIFATAWGHAGGDEKDPKQPARKDVSRKGKKKKARKESQKMPALRFEMKDIDGRKQNLAQYHGNVILMVNVASYCGLTPQYEGLQADFEKYKDRGFVVLGFPANNFGAQEPKPNDEIKAFCTSKFDVTFPMFAKVSVKGEDICPLYRYLTDEKADHGHGGEIEWNFAKFLVNRKGEVVARFHPKVKPDDAEFLTVLEKHLAEPIPEDSPLAEKMKKKDAKPSSDGSGDKNSR